MTKRPKLAELRKKLLALPESQREAILRRAKLRSVEGHGGANGNFPQQIREDILCQFTPTGSEKIHPIGKTLRPENCSPAEIMGNLSINRLPKGRQMPSNPITNLPAPSNYDGGVPDAVTMEIFGLRRRNAELTLNVEESNRKLTKVLECLQSLRRFFRLWVYEGQGETYDEIGYRMKHIDGTIDLIENRAPSTLPELKLPERWNKNRTK